MTRVSLEVIKTIKPTGLGDLVDILDELGLNKAAQEQIWVIALDAANNIRTITEVAVGSYHDAFVAVPTIISPVFLAGTDRFILAHNHPPGNTKPTVDDIDLTARVQAAAEVCDLEFDDHIIVTPSGHWASMRGLGHLRRAA